MEKRSDPHQPPVQHAESSLEAPMRLMGVARPARAGTIFALIISAYFLDVIDASIVTVAIPTIQAEFGASLAESQWIYGAYSLTLAGFLLFMGRAGDIYGQKKVFVIGLAVFTIASFLGGLAPSLLSLIAFRLVQGVAAATTTVTAFAIFMSLYPEGPQRNRAMGIFIAVISGGFAAGSVVGGVLTQFVGWRSVMFVNVPIGIVSVILCQRILPNLGGWVKNQRLDVPGAATVTAGTVLFVYALTNAATLGFASQMTTIPLALSVLILVAFLAIEKRSQSPLMPLSFISRGSILTANALAIVLTSIVGGISFIVTIYLQEVLVFSPLDAGLSVLPAAVIFFLVGGWGASRIVQRIGVRNSLVVSSVLITLGVAELTIISVQGSYFDILPGILVWALGASIGFPAVNIAAVAGTKHGEEGLASGVINTSFRIGFPFGLAILLTIAAAFAPAGAGSDPEAVVTGFRYALAAGVLFGLLSFPLILRIKEPRPFGIPGDSQSHKWSNEETMIGTTERKWRTTQNPY